MMSRFHYLIVSAAAGLLCTCGLAPANPLIGLNFTAAASSLADPQNWNRVSISEGTLSNFIDETGAATGVGITVGGSPLGPNNTAGFGPPNQSLVPQYDYSLRGMAGAGFRNNPFFFTLDGLEPNTPYEYWYVGYRAGTTFHQLVSVSDGDTIDAFTFTQLKDSNQSRFFVNTTFADGSHFWNELSLTTNSSSTGTLTFNVAATGGTPVNVVGAIAIRVVPEPAALSLLAAGPILMLRRRRSAAPKINSYPCPR